MCGFCFCFFFFSSRRRHTRYWRGWSSDVCSSDLGLIVAQALGLGAQPPNSAVDQLPRANRIHANGLSDLVQVPLRHPLNRPADLPRDRPHRLLEALVTRIVCAHRSIIARNRTRETLPASRGHVVASKPRAVWGELPRRLSQGPFANPEAATPPRGRMVG